MGVDTGDRVVLFMGNQVEFVISIFACSMVGAIAIPVNTGWRTLNMQYLLNEAEPKVAIVDPALRAGYEEAISSHPTPPIVVSTGDQPVLEGRPFDLLLADHAPILADSYVVPSADQPVLVLYTSGTTGPSKGVVLGQRMCLAITATFELISDVNDGDVSYTAGPIFHVNALFCSVLAPLAVGARAVVAPKFSASRFWQQVRSEQATIVNLMGNMSAFLLKQPERSSDRDHRVRLSFGSSEPEFERRFGANARSRQYGLTDAGVPIFVAPDEAYSAPPASCGRASELYECLLVDDDDQPVPVGSTGELVLRPRVPFVMSAGYWSKPEATLRAWRNLWFHTGDYLRTDADGWYYFVDRKSDSIRRSGENIASYEVEQALKSHPAVEHAAAFGVPSEHGDEEVMVVVTTKPDAVVAPADLVAACRDLLPVFAVPRYVDIVPSMPMTKTGKVAKGTLRERGLTATAFDGGDGRRGSTSHQATVGAQDHG
jgi:carnitine-CoA ligase